MRILFVAPRFHTNQYQVVKTLQENNHEVIFHVSYVGPTEDHTLLKPVNFKQSKVSHLIEKTFRKGKVKKPYYFPNAIGYWKNFRSLNPDVVVIRDPFKNYFSLMAAFYARLTNKKIVFYSQEELYKARATASEFKKNIAIKFFNAAWMSPITGSEKGIIAAPKHMYYVPLPITAKSKGLPISDEEPKILMVGKYHQDRKKHLLLVKAVSQLYKHYTFKVTIVGECMSEGQIKKYQKLKQEIQALGLANIVDLKQNVSFDKMSDLYASHQIFVLPAINEPYSISILEALGCGLPVICTDTCGTRFNIQNGENGYVIKSNSLEELTSALESLVSDRKRLEEMSRESFDYAVNHLSGYAFYSRFIEMLEERYQLAPSEKVYKVNAII